MSVLLKNILLYKYDIFEKSNVFIDDGKVAALGDSALKQGAEQVFDFKNKYLIIPGFVDVHVHLRQPGFSYKETIKTGTLAAASAGYTAVCAMPNLNPVPDCLKNLKEETDIINKDAVIDVFPYASITIGRKGAGECVDFKSLYDKVIAFSDDGSGIQDQQIMENAMKECSKLDSIIAAHCEVNSLLNGGYIHEGKYCREHNHKGISSESEWREVERDCNIALKTNCKLHICHVSTKESVEIIRKAKMSGARVTCETAPHYLTLSDDDLKDDGRYKVNPPIRSVEDKNALIEGIKDGTIDIIATDHAPHSIEEKSRGLRDSAMGISGIETAFPILYTKLVKTGIITLGKLVELMCINPRYIFQIDGGLSVGNTADLAVIDLNKKWTINGNDFISMGKSTPFENMKVFGKNVMTIKKGKIIYDKRI